MVQANTATAIAEQVRDGDEIIIDTSRPRATLEAILARDDLTDVVVTMVGYPYDDSSVITALAGHDGISVQLSMVPPDVRNLVADGTIPYIPRTLYQTARAPGVEPDRRTVGIVQTPPPTDDNSQPLGCLSTFGKPLTETANVSIIETNPRIPSPPHCERVDSEHVDFLVEGDTPPPTISSGRVDGADEVADNLVSLVSQDCTIQLGVGGLMTAIGTALADGGPYSLWTGLLGESVRPLFENDLVSEATCCVAIGSDPSFYEWVNTLDDVSFVSGTVSHAPTHLAEHSNFVAVNSALQVDLYGQINAETLGGRQISGVGGQSAFMMAASNHPEGLAVIALTSRARNGASKIVDMLPENELVTTPRYAVDAVVTEYGVARLTACSVDERASALISVAHPEDRPALRETARDRGLL